MSIRRSRVHHCPRDCGSLGSETIALIKQVRFRSFSSCARNFLKQAPNYHDSFRYAAFESVSRADITCALIATSPLPITHEHNKSLRLSFFSYYLWFSQTERLNQ